jgi:putative DNA primase/helicase
MEFRSFLHSIGLEPRVIEAGKWLRCPTVNHPRKKNGSFKLAECGQIGWAIDYAVHAEHVVWQAAAGMPHIKIDHAAIAARRAAERTAAAQASAAALAYYTAADHLHGNHPYLAGKGLSVAGCGGLRVDQHGSLLIPMMIDGKLSSLQRITPAGEKRFWPGAPTSRAIYQIGGNALFTVICEGFATGLTVYQAMPQARILVAFNAGNLSHAAGYLTGCGVAVIAADNDHETFQRININPGLNAAKIAADSAGIDIAYPTCTGTDWDDYRQERTAALAEAATLSMQRRGGKDIHAVVATEIAMALKRKARRPAPRK